MGCQSSKGSEEDCALAGVKFSIDPTRQGAFALNDPPGDDALVVIDPVIPVSQADSNPYISRKSDVLILSGAWNIPETTPSRRSEISFPLFESICSDTGG